MRVHAELLKAVTDEYVCGLCGCSRILKKTDLRLLGEDKFVGFDRRLGDTQHLDNINEQPLHT